MRKNALSQSFSLCSLLLMTNAKYSPRNYIIVKRGSIAHVLYIIHAEGSLYQFFSRERLP